MSSRFKKPPKPGTEPVTRTELAGFVELRLQRFLTEQVIPAVRDELDGYTAALETFIEQRVIERLIEAGFERTPAPGALVNADGAPISSAQPVPALVGPDGSPL